MELPHHAKRLLLHLNQQRARGFLCDVIVTVDTELFRAHKSVLAASSSYFQALVVHDNLITLDTEMVKPAVFQQILDFIYTGKLSSSSSSNQRAGMGEQDLRALLTAANYLQLPELAGLCRRQLKHSVKSWSGRPYPDLEPDRNPSTRPNPAGLNPLSSQKILSSAALSLPPSLSLSLPPSLSLSLPPSLSLPSSSDVVPGRKRSRGNSRSYLGNSRAWGLDLPRKSPTVSKATGSDGLLGNASSSSSRQEQPDGAQERRWSHQGGPTREGRWPNRAWLESHSGKGFVSEGEREGEEEERRARVEDGSPSDFSANYVYRPFLFPLLGSNLYVCIPCGRGFPSAESLNAHVETHNGEEEEQTHGGEKEEDEEEEEAEDLSSATSLAMTEVSTEVTEVGEVCRSCPKAYGNTVSSRQHERSSCPKVYGNAVSLWQHKRGSRRPTQPFPCGVCGRLFTQRGTMTRHMRSHLGLKPFACTECGVRFTRQYRLAEHTRVHSGEKPYACQVCGSKFTQQRNLISHLRMHTALGQGSTTSSPLTLTPTLTLRMHTTQGQKTSSPT